MLNQTWTNRITIAIGVTLLLLGIALVYERSGILAWTGVMLGAGLLLKTWLRPSPMDLPVSLSISSLWLLAWVGIFYYVISTWETGEVVELTVATSTGAHTARVWILEDPDSLMLYYDAPAHAAQALMQGAPLTVIRGGQPLSFKGYEVKQSDEMPEEEITQVLTLMSEKYGDKVDAADIFYGFLGRARDRIAVVIELR